MTVLNAATDGRSLRSWKSLYYEELDGDPRGRRSVRLNVRSRLVFELNEEAVPQTITILAIEDCH
jgi:plasmid maintenance system killer protein